MNACKTFETSQTSSFLGCILFIHACRLTCNIHQHFYVLKPAMFFVIFLSYVCSMLLFLAIYNFQFGCCWSFKIFFHSNQQQDLMVLQKDTSVWRTCDCAEKIRWNLVFLRSAGIIMCSKSRRHLNSVVHFVVFAFTICLLLTFDIFLAF